MSILPIQNVLAHPTSDVGDIHRFLATFDLDAQALTPGPWLHDRLTGAGLSPSDPEPTSTGQIRIRGRLDGAEFAVSVTDRASAGGRIVVYVEPTLTFWQGLRGREDDARLAATRVVHDLLSASPGVRHLQWFERSRVWKGGTPTPGPGAG